MITDRPRFIVEEANTGVILYRDLEVIEPQFGGQLSGPATLKFNLAPLANFPVIPWGKNRQWVHVEMEFDGVRRLVVSAIVKSAIPDPETGVMAVECEGFSNYPKNKPWLEDYNPIAVDPFEVFARVWAHVQSFSNAQLGVEIYPQDSGTQMLPGFGFDGSTLVFDFFALFIRAVDFNDCADQINGLSRDIPFDYFEESFWNEDRTEISKRIHLAYPKGGVRQEHLAFILGENVSKAELADEKDIDPVTDVVVRGWFPGKVYNAKLGNISEEQFRDVVLEEDAKINSTERAAAWAKRKLQKRTVPKYWKKIVIDPEHPNAPFGSFGVGDEVFVRAQSPWYGEIALWHRIVTWAYDPSSGLVELGLKVEGAFNYDPIDYDPDYEEELPRNLLGNGYFGRNLLYWTRIAGAWIRVSNDGFETNGCVRIDCDDGGEALRSERIPGEPGDHFSAKCHLKWSGVTSTAGPGFILRIIFSQNGVGVSQLDLDTYDSPTGIHAWERLEGEFVMPEDANEFAVQLTVTPNVTGGQAFWDDVVAIDIEVESSPVTVVGYSQASGSAPSVSCDKPTGTANEDTMIAIVSSEWNTAGNITAPGGWSVLDTEDRGTDELHTKIFTKVAGGSEPSNYSFGSGSGSDVVVSMITVRGAAASGWVFNTISDGDTDTSIIAPSLSGVGDVLISFGMIGDNPTFTSPGSMTEILETGTTYIRQVVAIQESPANPTGNKVFTSSLSPSRGSIAGSILIPRV